MTCWRGILRSAAGIIAIGMLGLTTGWLQAGERSHAFIEGLRQRQYFDTALDYLESIRNSRLADASFLDVIDYEVGITLMESSLLLPMVDREKRLNEARVAFDKFVTVHSQHWLAIEAQAHLANLLVNRGRLKMALAARFKRTPEDKEQLWTEARALYQDAQKLFVIIDKSVSNKLKDYKTIDYRNPHQVAQRDQLRTDSMHARLALGSIIYEIARTYEPDSDEYKENLAAAAKHFAEYAEKYSKWVGGYYALVDEARCYQELGNYAKALDLLTQVREKEEFHEGFHRVRSVATMLAIRIAMLPEVKQYKKAMDFYEYWETNVAQRKETTEEALAIKCLTGEASLEYARSVKVDSLQAVKHRSNLLQQAKDLFVFVTEHPSEYRRRARIKLADPLLSGRKPRPGTAGTYAEARDRARIAWDRLRGHDLDPGEEPELRTEALRNFRFALAHTPSDVEIEDLNSIRYYLAYLYWSSRKYYDAAVIGEFLARHYPNRAEAQQAAKLAMASYSKILDESASSEDQRLEKDRMVGIAQFITDRWPNSSAADEAWMILIRVAIKDNELEKATEYLSHVSQQSPRRGETELLTGQTLWTAYLDAMYRPKANRLPESKMSEMFSEAQKALEDGVARMRKPVDAGGQVSESLATAVLSLTQIYLELGQPEKAIQWLDDLEIGPYTLIVAKHKIVRSGNFRVETLKAAMRAYVAALQLDHLEETMGRLEKDAGEANLSQIYLILGRQLNKSLKKIRAENDKEKTAHVVQGFTALLDHLVARPLNETDFDTLYWAADMYANLASDVDSNNRRLLPAATNFYRKAVKTYRAILKASLANPKFAPEREAILNVRMRLADALVSLGEYGPAVDTLVEVLKVQGNLIEPQRKLAYTYQAWGEENPKTYLLAIHGGSSGKQQGASLAWGWGGIARHAMSDESHQDLFHEARYNLALCRSLYAMSKLGQQRIDLLNQAERDISILYRLYPKMGGKEWFDQYDALLRKIQRLLGVREVGLKSIEDAISKG